MNRRALIPISFSGERYCSPRASAGQVRVLPGITPAFPEGEQTFSSRGGEDVHRGRKREKENTVDTRRRRLEEASLAFETPRACALRHAKAAIMPFYGAPLLRPLLRFSLCPGTRTFLRPSSPPFHSRPALSVYFYVHMHAFSTPQNAVMVV